MRRDLAEHMSAYACCRGGFMSLSMTPFPELRSGLSLQRITSQALPSESQEWYHYCCECFLKPLKSSTVVENSAGRHAVSLHRATCEVITSEVSGRELYHPTTRVASVQRWRGIYGYPNSQFFSRFKVIDFLKIGSLGDKARLKSHRTGWPSVPNSSVALFVQSLSHVSLQPHGL